MSPRPSVTRWVVALVAGIATALPLTVVSALPTAASPVTTPARVGAIPEPVVDADFPDPDVLLVDGVYHAYATNNVTHKVQHRTSHNLRRWTEQPDAAPGIGEAPGDWVGPCRTLPDGSVDYCVWAPEVTEVDGGYALYYTARDAASGRQCIGLATATSPDGPFVDTLGEPFVCPTDLGGAIDAATVRDGDDLYLMWKSDGNCCALPAVLFVQPLSSDGATLTGPPVEMLRNDLPWTGAVVEAPTMVEHDGTWYAFFSANDYYGGAYRTGWATAPSVTGPFTVQPGELMTSDDFFGEIRGPGGQDVVTTRQGGTALLFHGWDADYSTRSMYATDLTFAEDGTPVVRGAATRYEAEDARVENAAVVDDSSASGLAKVGGLDHPDSAVTFTVHAPRTGEYRLGIRFANGSLGADGTPATATHRLSVDGVAVQDVDYWHTRWGNWQTLELPVDLAKGTHTLTLTRTDLYAEIDAVLLARQRTDGSPVVHPEALEGATRYEAEDGVVTNARVRQAGDASGGAAVGGLDFPDSSIALRVYSETGGDATLGIRFANGSERGGYPVTAVHAVSVDGVDAGRVRYPHTQWGNWNVIEHDVTLAAGWTTVTLTRVAWYAEIDAVDVVAVR